MDTGLKVEALTWAGELVTLRAKSLALSSTANILAYLAGAVDGTAVGFAGGTTPPAGAGGTAQQTVSSEHASDALSEGYYSFTAQFRSSSAGTSVSLVQDSASSPSLFVYTRR